MNDINPPTDQQPLANPPTDQQPLTLKAGDITSALEHLGPAPAPAPALIRWSALLESLAKEDRIKPLQEFERAVHKGVIAAATLRDTFTLHYLDAQGQNATHEGQDDLLLDTPELRAWLATQVNESRYLLIQNGAPIQITQQQIENGELDFARLSAIRKTVAGQRVQTPAAPQAKGTKPTASKSKAGTKPPAPQAKATTTLDATK
ncbi:hypothetical protein LAJ19_16780 (plasmid) [Deinococcus taeanensis]|uniref:hypothetical protein n=1 Tax=Deinococcus taeanensis TaxID=2737050 RepID=UPI001CDD45EA|nr:hypothetical protein [Deinococcus taeanensis]UBV44443.1 hypothetical protein LAJ19_16780 [Deinococcus taeanensis]